MMSEINRILKDKRFATEDTLEYYIFLPLCGQKHLQHKNA